MRKTIKERRRAGELWSVSDVALGSGISVSAIQKYQDRLPPRVQVGRRWYWTREQLVDVLLALDAAVLVAGRPRLLSAEQMGEVVRLRGEGVRNSNKT